MSLYFQNMNIGILNSFNKDNTLHLDVLYVLSNMRTCVVFLF